MYCSSVNRQPSKDSLHLGEQAEQPGHEKSISPREVVSQQRRSSGFEILSLLDSEEDAQAEPPTLCAGTCSDRLISTAKILKMLEELLKITFLFRDLFYLFFVAFCC